MRYALPLSVTFLTLSLTGALIAAEPEENKIEVQIESISSTNTIQFDQNAKVRRSNAQFQVMLKILPPAGMDLVASRGVQISECQGDTGESLVPRSGGDNWRNGEQTFHEYQRERNEYQVNCQLGNPAQMPNALRSLKGTVTVAVAKGTSKQAKLGPIKDWLGKSVEIEAIKEELLVERSAGEIKLVATRKLFDHVQKITFQDSKSKEIRSNGWSSSSNNDEYTRSFRLTLPDDGAIILQLLPEVTEVPVGFSFTDLPLRAGPKAAKEKGLKLKIEDIPEAPKNPDGKHKAEGVKDPAAKGGGF